MRNLKKDLETCRKATPGAWNMVHGNKDQVAEKALDLACERMKEQCPANALCMGYCEKENCENNVAKCWKEYFLMKARESE